MLLAAFQQNRLNSSTTYWRDIDLKCIYGKKLNVRKNKDFWLDNGEIWPKIGFLVILGQILAFLAHFVPCLTKIQCKQGAQVFFFVMWVPRLLLSPVIIRIFCPKTTQFYPKIEVFGHFGPGHAGSYGALLVGWLVVVERGMYLARHLFTLFF